MISNQILKNTIEGIKSISRVDLYVADTDGQIVVSTAHAGDQCFIPKQGMDRGGTVSGPYAYYGGVPGGIWTADGASRGKRWADILPSCGASQAAGRRTGL